MKNRDGGAALWISELRLRLPEKKRSEAVTEIDKANAANAGLIQHRKKYTMEESGKGRSASRWT